MIHVRMFLIQREGVAHYQGRKLPRQADRSKTGLLALSVA